MFSDKKLIELKSDANDLEKLHNHIYDISNDVKPFETIIKDTKDDELNISPHSIRDNDVKIHSFEKIEIRPYTPIILKDFSSSQQKIKLKHYNIRYPDVAHIDNSIQQKQVLGEPELPQGFKPRAVFYDFGKKTKPEDVSDSNALKNELILDPLGKKVAQYTETDHLYEEFEKRRLALEEERQDALKKIPLDTTEIERINKINIKKGYQDKIQNQIKVRKPLVIEKNIPEPLTDITSENSIPSNNSHRSFKRSTNSKKIGDGYVKKEVDIINNNKKDIIFDENEYNGDSDDDDNDNEDLKYKTPVPFNKPIKIDLSEEKKAIYRKIMDMTPKPKHFTNEEIDELKEVFDMTPQTKLSNKLSRAKMYDLLKLKFNPLDFDLAPQTTKSKKK